MAFQWLAMLPALISAGGGLLNASRGRDAIDEIPTLQPYLDNLARAERYGAAAGDSQDPFFLDVQADRNEQNRKSSVEAILRIMRMNARDKARGGVGFGINPERRDESRASALAEAFQDAKIKSRLEARDTLLRLSQNARGNALGYAGSFPTFSRFGDLEANNRASMIEGGADLAGGLLGLFGNKFGGDGGLSRSLLSGPNFSNPPGTGGFENINSPGFT